MADLQHTAVSAVVIAVPAVLRLAVFTVICHGVHPPENGYKKIASVQPLKAFSPEGETDAQGVFVFDFGNKKWAKRPSLTPSTTSAIQFQHCANTMTYAANSLILQAFSGVSPQITASFVSTTS